MFTVQVRVVPGDTEFLNEDNPVSVERCLQRAACANPTDFNSWTIKKDGVSLTSDNLSDTIDSDTVLTLTPKKVKGNC